LSLCEKLLAFQRARLLYLLLSSIKNFLLLSGRQIL